MKVIKILQKIKKTPKNKNTNFNYMKIHQKVENKNWLSIEKDIKCKNRNARLLIKVSVFKNKNVKTLGWPRFQFLDVGVGENASILV